MRSSRRGTTTICRSRRTTTSTCWTRRRSLMPNDSVSGNSAKQKAGVEAPPFSVAVVGEHSHQRKYYDVSGVYLEDGILRIVKKQEIAPGSFTYPTIAMYREWRYWMVIRGPNQGAMQVNGDTSLGRMEGHYSGPPGDD